MCPGAVCESRRSGWDGNAEQIVDAEAGLADDFEVVENARLGERPLERA